jgi:hypothetical protein
VKLEYNKISHIKPYSSTRLWNDRDGSNMVRLKGTRMRNEEDRVNRGSCVH